MYIQSRKRAYFDFLIPVPLDFDPAIYLGSKRDRFVRTLCTGALDRDLGVSIWTSGLSNGRATMINIGDPDVALEYGATSHFKALLPFKKDRVLREGTSWAENVRTGIMRRLMDPKFTLGFDDGADMALRNERWRHNVHYYMKKDACPILETPPHTSKFRTAIIRVEKRDGSTPNIRLDRFVAQAAWDAGLCHRFGEQAIVENTKSWLDERGLDDFPSIQQFLFTPTKVEAVTPSRQIIRTERLAPPKQQDLRHRVELQRPTTSQIGYAPRGK
jgi:hypothetical protein